jgi:hypothetical protein
LGSAPNLVRIFAFRPADGPWASASQAQAIQTAYNSSQQELEELQVAALEACQGLDDASADVEMNRLDALTAPGANVLAEDFMEILFRGRSFGWPPRALKVVGRSSPLSFLLELGPCSSCNKHNLVKTFEFL